MNTSKSSNPSPIGSTNGPWLLKRTVGIFLGIVALFLSVLGVGSAALWQQSIANSPVRDIQGALDFVSVQGLPGAIPVVTVERSLEIGLMKEALLVTGDGRKIQEGYPVLLAIYPFSAADGSYLGTDSRSQLKVGLATEATLGTELFAVVVGRTEGSRVLVVRPTDTGDTEINVVDILPTIANGTPEADSPGPLTVRIADEGPIISHDGEPPTETVVQTLLQGNGQQIRAGDDIVLQYLALSWTTGMVIDSSWDQGIPQSIKLDQSMTGLQEALVDKRVGSRLAITIPPDAATGEDTLAIVVDILGTGPAK